MVFGQPRASTSGRHLYQHFTMQVQINGSIEDMPVLERIIALLSAQSDPTDPRTCAFGKLPHFLDPKGP